MREELEQKLFLRWPTWFDVQGFEHGEGWFDILWRLFAKETQRVRTRGESGRRIGAGLRFNLC